MSLRDLLDEITPDPDSTIVDLTFGPSVLAGTGGSDWIIAGEGEDTAEAADGDDFVSKSVGTGMVYGGAGRDTLYLRDVLTEINRDATYHVDLRSDEAFLRGVPEGTFKIALDSIENLAGSNRSDELLGDGGRNVLAGYGGRDTLVGRNGDDALWGGNGSDDLEGGSGDDYLHGGRGFYDFLDGGEGNDTIDGGGGYDAALYWRSDGITVSRVSGTDNAFVVTDGQWEDRLFNIEEIWGSDGDDVYRTGAGDTTIDAGAGKDRIFSGAGSDDLQGGAGNDRMFGGAGRDSLNGDAGKDHIWGDGSAPAAADHFFFEPDDTGATSRGRADVIHDFDDSDTIVLISNSDLRFSDDRWPERGMYTVFEREDDHVVRWREMSGSANDIVVKGNDPTDNIDLVMFDADGGWSYTYDQ